MDRLSFLELVECLARGDEFKPRKLQSGVSSPTTSNPRFVAPDLAILEPFRKDSTSVVLVSAPGAVGKSTFAAELATRTGSLLWDLSQIQVGTGTFAGVIFSTYGFETEGVLKRLSLGNFLFVLDALDEAQVRSGSQNFDAFLSDIAEFHKAGRQRPTIVLFARTDTADWIQLFLEDADVPLARLQIDFFNEEQSHDFLDRRLDERRRADGESPRHRQQREPFLRARKALFDLIVSLFSTSKNASWKVDEVRQFLGYAPVLEALADYLDFGNFSALVNEISEGAGSARDPWQFLVELIRRLMSREAGKFQDGMKLRLEAPARAIGWSNWEVLYEGDEQCGRVLSHVLQVPTPATTIPNALASGYEEAISMFLPQHPFLSGKSFTNVVFREFVYSWALSNLPEETKVRLRQRMSNRESPFLPSKLFAHFLVAEDDGQLKLIDGQDFGLVVESLAAKGGEFHSTIVQDGDDFVATLEFADGKDTPRSILLLDSGSGIHFWRRMSNTAIDVDCAVRLGLVDQRFHLGPNVDAVCASLEVLSEDLDIDVIGDVHLAAERLIPNSSIPKLRLRNEGEGQFSISWPNPAHPWVHFKAPSDTKSEIDWTLPATKSLRKFILLFSRQRSRKIDAVRNKSVDSAGGGIRDALVELAIDHGVLREVKGIDVFEFNSEFDSLKSLLSASPVLTDNARAFVRAVSKL